MNTQQLDDLNSSLNVLLRTVKEDTSEFPPFDLLDEIKQCLEFLANSPKMLAKQRAEYISLSWPADLRVVLNRLFRTFKIPEEYIQSCYELSNCAAQSLGADWLKSSDAQFVRLLASLSSGRLRVLLDKPEDINMAQLIACLQLQEYFFGCVEDEQCWMSDDDATFVAKCCQEAAAFVFSYMAICARQMSNISLHMDLFLVLYRFICAFLSINGSAIIDATLLKEGLPPLIDVCKYCLSQRDASMSWFLLGNIPDFADPLPPDVLGLIMQYVGLSKDSSTDRDGTRSKR
uniref:Uncharacterized protein n=1 Tax=Globodera rostochiensis TaxID=31243 RepID=A0A914HYD1_GLORO